jgi:hypothetical protein
LVQATKRRPGASRRTGMDSKVLLNKELPMNNHTHYVVTQRFESDFHRPSLRADSVLPKRVYRWAVDGPFLLAWGSDAHVGASDLPAEPTGGMGLFKHWFRQRDFL